MHIHNMHKRFIVLLLTAVVFSLTAGAQKSKPMKWKDVIALPEVYITGTGTADNDDDARESAKRELVSSISTSVASRIERILKSQNNNGKLDEEMVTTQILNTYSAMDGLEGLIFMDVERKGGQVTKGCYISRAALEETFKKRGESARNYSNTAIVAERDAAVGTALRQFYWAYALVNSYPKGDEEETFDASFHHQNMMAWIPEEMANICKGIKAEAIERETDEDGETHLVMHVTYKDRDAQDLCLTATADGMSDQTIYVKDGKAELTVPDGIKENKIRLNIDWRGGSATNCMPGLANAIKLIEKLDFGNTVIKLNKAYAKKPETTYAMVELQQPTKAHGPIADEVATNRVEVYQQNFVQAEQAKPHIEVAKKIESILRQRQFEQLKPLCTAEGWEMADKLFRQYGTARLVGHPNIQFMETTEGVAIRSFPMSFKFRSNRGYTTTENVVFHLNKSGLITSIAFALETSAADDVLTQGEWPKESRQIIIDFLEGYKTSFATKDDNYIEKVFSDEALIIMGRFVKTRPRQSGDIQFRDAKKVEYTRYTKEEYLKHMRDVFSRTEYVNVKFGDNQIKQGGYTNRITKEHKTVYGIQIKQDYYSSSYGDTGYLFLAVDLSNPSEPVIHIRTWQPYKDVKNSDEEGDNAYGEKIFGIEDFH